MTQPTQPAQPLTMTTVIRVDHLIVGGGVVGLAIGARLAQMLASRSYSGSVDGSVIIENSYSLPTTVIPESINEPIKSSLFGRPISVLLIDRHPYLANEASSRNSEVIHAGLYYPLQSLKMKYCLRGRRMLYDYCTRFNIPHRRTGKWLVSTTTAEHKQLEQLYSRIQSIPKTDHQLRWLDRQEWQAKEPGLAPDRIHSVLESPQSGIVDSHSLICTLEAEMLDAENAHISLNSRAEAPILRLPSGSYQTPVTITRPTTPRRPEPIHQRLIIESKTVINSAGLWADQIAASLCSHRNDHRRERLLPTSLLADYKVYPCKGHYYSLTSGNSSSKSSSDNNNNNNNITPAVSRLIYPVPDPSLRSGLGIHLTPDMSGRIRLGPDAEYFEPDSPEGRYDFSIDDTGTPGELERRRRFMQSVQRYLQLDLERDWDRVRVDYSSVRCKLRPLSTGAARDFIVADEKEHGAPGFINLIGIESPGLTSSLAIAEDVVERLMQPYLE